MAETIQIVSTPLQFAVGDTDEPFSVYLTLGGVPVSLSGATVEFKMLAYDSDDTSGNPRYDATPKVVLTSANVTAEPTKAYTADNATDELISEYHRVPAGSLVSFDTTGGGITADTPYVVTDVSENRFKIKLSDAAGNVNITGTPSGNFYVIGHVQYAWQTADVDTAGRFGAWIKVTRSAKSQMYPPDRTGVVVWFTEPTEV